MGRTFFRRAVTLALPVCTLAFGAVAFGHVANAACTATGFIRDGNDLTAAPINPSKKVSGDVTAAGCNIGIYFGRGSRGQVDGANIHDANYFGIVNNGGDVKIQNSNISDIGEKPINGAQHGVGIYFVFGSASKGNIQNNMVSRYQKGGIVVNGSASNVNVQQNTVIGLGPVNFIAQNGIQVGYGAKAQVQNNLVSGNAYTGAGQTASAGVLVVGGDCNGGPLMTNTQVQNNTALGNDVGVWMTNLDASCNPPAASTKNTAQGNTLIDNEVTNTTGDGAKGYQAGVSDQGNGDTIQNNDTCGPGYTPPGTATADLFAIDASFSINAKVKNNTVCGDNPGNGPSSAATARAAGKAHGKRASAAK
jgi:parallel beta-helix repeat protein